MHPEGVGPDVISDCSSGGFSMNTYLRGKQGYAFLNKQIGTGNIREILQQCILS